MRSSIIRSRIAALLLAAPLGVSPVACAPLFLNEGAHGFHIPQQTTIAAGAFHSCISLNGSAYCAGDDTFSELGDNYASSPRSATKVRVRGAGGAGFLSAVATVTAGSYHSCALTTSGKVYCWGQGSSGQLGNGTCADSGTPVQVAGVGGVGTLSRVSAIAGNYTSSCALSDGQVYCWGSNALGELGDNSGTSQRCFPAKVVGPGGAGFLSSVTAIAGTHAWTSVCAISGGNVYCWGQGAGPLTYGSTPNKITGVGGVGYLSNVTAVSVGEQHTCAIVSGGSAYCWGEGIHGELGNGVSAASTTPVQVVGVGGVGFLASVTAIAASGDGSGIDDFSCAVSGGHVYCWGYNDGSTYGTGVASNTPVEVAGVGGVGFLSSIVAISTGSTFSCAVGSGNSFYCWGDGPNGQFGSGTLGNSLNPVVSYP